MKDKMCRCANQQKIMIQYFSRSYVLFQLRNLAKLKETTETVCQRNSSESVQQNFVKLYSYKRHIMLICISTGTFESIFLSRSFALFQFRNLAKMKETTETVCQHNSSETAQQNFVKLCSYEGQTMWMCISTGTFNPFFFLRVTPFFNLEIWPK